MAVDYVVRNYRTEDKIEKLKIREKVGGGSDYQPVEITLKMRVEKKREGRREEGKYHSREKRISGNIKAGEKKQ